MSADIIDRLMSAECYDYGRSSVVVGWLRNDPIEEAAEEIKRLRARVAQLEAAIKPLASLPLWPEELAAMGDRDLTIGEIRAARAALKETTP